MTTRTFMVGRALALFAALVVVPALASGARFGGARFGGARSGVSRDGNARDGNARDGNARAVVTGRDRTTWDSVFTADQATRGQSSYNQTCARCHRETLAGGDEAPALTGSAFMSSWNGQTLDEMHERVRTSMPTDTPGVYARPMVTDVIAYVLNFNGFPAGSVELTHENDALKGIRFVATKP